MYVLVSYDIVKDSSRNRVMKFLKDYGAHVQKSVFECHLDDQRYLDLKDGIKGLINPREDRVRFYSMCRSCTGRVEISGCGTITEEEEFTII